ncbi:MAG: FAD-binding oxidoreductase [Dehalococcoidia bacterium]|nr:FAD-binding oxidoreductase [Dehalococcoidia bacterium]
MTSVTAATVAGGTATIDEPAVADLRGKLQGPLLRADDDGYEAARRVWNGNIDRHPALIARCTGVADLMAAVRFARDNSLVVVIRGGAHNAAGNGTIQGGMLIDLSLMKGIQVDPVQRIARAQGGVAWKEFDREAQAFDLGTTGGTVSNTGLAGLTLGGGVGWLMGKHGLTVDNLLSVDLVTAGGEFLKASEEHNPDLFWGLRGGGGNFGVATSFEYRLHPVGPAVLGGMVLHPMAAARDVLRFYREFCGKLPDEAEALVALITAPDGTPLIALILGYNGPIDEGERVLAPARQCGSPVHDAVGPLLHAVRNTLLDEPNAIHGIQRYWKSGFSRDLSDGLIDTMVETAQSFTSPPSAILAVYIHGAATRIAPTVTAFGLRDVQWDVNLISQWTAPDESPLHIDWTRRQWGKMEKDLSGTAYLNHLAGDDRPEKVRASYGPNYDGLLELKRKYDPTNMFRINANISPAAP